MIKAPEVLLYASLEAFDKCRKMLDASLGFEISTFRSRVVEGGARGFPDLITPAAVFPFLQFLLDRQYVKQRALGIASWAICPLAGQAGGAVTRPRVKQRLLAWHNHSNGIVDNSFMLH